MYSLILSDDVVAAVDRLAYQQGLSRSALVNQVLAGYASMTTPQQHVEDIFRLISTLTRQESTLQIPVEPSGSVLQVKSVLRYKYNPTIRYAVELTPTQAGYTGWFRTVSRTQSEALRAMLVAFYQLWDSLERQCIARAGLFPDIHSEVEEGRYRRRLRVEENGQLADAQRLGEAIAAYIHLFDRCLEQYFSAGGRVDQALLGGMAEAYARYLQRGICL